MINDQVTIGWKIIGLNQKCITRLCKIKIYYSIGSYLEMKSGGTLRKSLYNGEESPQKFNWKVQYKINYYSNQSSSTSATFLSGNKGWCCWIKDSEHMSKGVLFNQWGIDMSYWRRDLWNYLYMSNASGIFAGVVSPQRGSHAIH